MLHFLLQGGGWFLLFGEEVFFEGCLIVDFLGGDDAA
jgi:hypothetical protein